MNHGKECLFVKEEDRYKCSICGVECTVRRSAFNISFAIEKALIQSPRQHDEIDEWLEKECNIISGSCSSIENLKYSIAREVAEKLWK